jgi:Radical SAM superfamily
MNAATMPKVIWLVQLDGSLPNLALMRISAHHRALGDTVRLFHGHNLPILEGQPDRVYVSLIFERSKPVMQTILNQVSERLVLFGGTGFDKTITLEQYGITAGPSDYSIYPSFHHSIGFSQRGCRLKCSFCVVPQKEGSVREEASILQIWRGDPFPRNIILLDNDFFGQPHWRERIQEIRDGAFKVNFSQGINARFLSDEAAEAIAGVDFRDADFKVRRLYTAWDNLKDEERLLAGLNRLVKYGVKPDHIMVYCLIGFWPGETDQDREYRIRRLLDFGCRPYPMPFVRTQELVGFQRWVIGAYAKRFSWTQFKAANYIPSRLYPDQSGELYRRHHDND